jgi:hypothetical protein
VVQCRAILVAVVQYNTFQGLFTAIYKNTPIIFFNPFLIVFIVYFVVVVTTFGSELLAYDPGTNLFLPPGFNIIKRGPFEMSDAKPLLKSSLHPFRWVLLRYIFLSSPMAE